MTTEIQNGIYASVTHGHKFKGHRHSKWRVIVSLAQIIN